MNNWYVYRHLRLDKNEPFYIGIGCKKDFQRAYETSDEKRNAIWIKIFKKNQIEVEILFENLTKEEASIKEQGFIKIYGRIDLKTGTLCNMTDGGDGIWNCIRSEETKKKLRDKKIGEKNPQFGIKQSEETRMKRRLSMTGKKKSDETKIKQHLSSITSGQAKKTEVYKFSDNSFIGSFESLSEACRFLGIPNNKAFLVAKGKRRQTKGYVFKYV